MPSDRINPPKYHPLATCQIFYLFLTSSYTFFSDKKGQNLTLCYTLAFNDSLIRNTYLSIG